MFHNLTEGNPYKIIIRLTVPILISYLVQQMYNMVDTMVVGRMVGPSALAAVGATGNIYFFISSFIMGLTQGFATVTANKFGAGEDKWVKKTIYHSLLLISGISVFLSVIALFFLEGFLNLMNTPEEIFRDAYGYISIIIAGMVITAVLNLFYALFRSLGDTRTPLLFLLFSSILNVVLDICFVKWMANGVRAVACATILSQLTALIICSVYTIRGRELFQMKKEDRVIDRDCVMALLRMGVPMAAQASITQVGFLALQSAINTFGVNVIAGYTAGNKLEQFCLQPLNAFGAAMAVYVGQNYGARKKERIREGVLASVLLAMGTAFLLGGTLRGFGTGLLGLFVESSDREVMSYGLQYVNTFSLFLWGVASILLFRNILQGMINVAVPMTVGALELIARIVWVIFLYRKGTYGMLCLVNPVTWVIAAVPLITGYFWMLHRKEKWE